MGKQKKPTVLVPGMFDDIRSPQVRLLQEAARLGPVAVHPWPDSDLELRTGTQPKFGFRERCYFLSALHYVDEVISTDTPPPENIETLCVDEEHDLPEYAELCEERGIRYRVFTSEDLAGFPGRAPDYHSPRYGEEKVVVTGCYDWFHTGHIRFFEESAEYGELHVVVGNDANLELLKGPGHPMYREEERRYLVQSIRFVEKAYIATGKGWLDAEPEIRRIRPRIYAVNEDGDKEEKREFCDKNGIRYVVMKRKPKEGLPRRSSTDLRGF